MNLNKLKQLGQLADTLNLTGNIKKQWIEFAYFLPYADVLRIVKDTLDFDEIMRHET